MRIHLVGADYEENLALAMLSAVAERGGHQATVVPFTSAAEQERVIATIVGAAPEVVGLSMQFQHRSRDFLELARHLRRAGYRGHVVAGGQFPTMAWREVLGGGHGIDSVVLHDGEETLGELLAALQAGRALAEVPGLALPGPAGEPTRTRARRLSQDLDALPFARRYRAHSLHVGVPFIPIVGSRGCWGACSFCSISTFYRDARHQGGARLLRLRSPENIAQEMAELWHAAGGRAIFCFHDDNLLLPRPEHSLARLGALRAALDARGVGPVAIVGKCRPDTLTAELARELSALGVIRLYVGVENASEAGAAHLNRAAQRGAVRQALAACREAGIFCCYNLLIFEPGATLDDVRENLRFVREHAELPVNFCRAEPYYGTPLQLGMAAQHQLSGNYLGFSYRIADDRTELLFRICSAAFRERNFAPEGVHNRYMSLGYAAKVLERFHPDDPRVAALGLRARQLTRRIALDTAERFENAVAAVERLELEDADGLARYTARLGLAVAAADRDWHQQLDALLGDMERVAAEAPEYLEQRRAAEKRRQLKRNLAVGLSLAVVWTGCKDDVTQVSDPLPWDGGQGGVYDPLPPDGGDGGHAGAGGQGGVGGQAGHGGQGGVGGQAGHGGQGGQGGQAGMPADPPAPDPDAGIRVGGEPGTAGAPGPADLGPQAGAAAGRDALAQHWDDTAPRDLIRTADLALFDPPRFALDARREGDAVVVTVKGSTTACSTRWEADGAIEGEGLSVRWTPAGPSDRIRVAMRTRGGVAVKSLGMGELRLAPAR